METPTKETRHRFGVRVAVDLVTGCHEWQGAKNPGGYGLFRVDGRSQAAHRVAYAWVFGDPKQLSVCHSCDNPCCVNVAHLFAGTARDNMRDAVRKGRMCRPTTSGRRSSFSERQRGIVEAYEARVSVSEIVARFNVSRQAVLYAVKKYSKPRKRGRMPKESQ
jgi:hypothetical protein